MSANIPLPSRLRYFLLVLSGVMLGFSFPPFHTGVFAAFAFVPLFIVFEEMRSIGKSFRASYVAFFVFSFLSLWWVGGFIHGKDLYLMMAGTSLLIAHPLFMFVPIIFFTLIHRYSNYTAAVLSFPFIWTAFEYLHSITQFAFPWLCLGNTQTYDLSAIQFASYTGVYGVSFWLLCINVVAYFLYKKLATNAWQPLSRQSIAAMFVIIVIYFLPKFYGNIVLQQKETSRGGKSVYVGIVQPNIDPFEKWQGHAEQQLAVLRDMTLQFSGRGIDLAVWPETAIPFFIFTSKHQHMLQQLRDLVDSINVSLFSGVPDFIYYTDPGEAPKSSRVVQETGQRYDYFNSSMLLQPRDPQVQKYAKMILVPFSERVPYAELFTFFPWLQWGFGLGGWAIGKDTTVFRLRTLDSSEVRFSNLICYESIYPGFVAQFVRRGAQFLTIITNDSWWDDTFGPYQHQQYAVMRAIENRRWVARCANGGISCFIDPFGNIIQATKMLARTTLIGEIQTNDERTFYSNHGDVFAQLCMIVSGLVVATAFGRKFYNVYRTRQ